MEDFHISKFIGTNAKRIFQHCKASQECDYLEDLHISKFTGSNGKKDI